MTPFVPLAMFGWIPLGLWLFQRFKGRLAIIAGFLIAWLFLPMYKYSLPGLPDYTKISALGYIMLLGVMLFDRERLTAFKLNALDLPILLFCSSSFFASVTNGLGAYDGLSATLGKLTMWFIPYLLGRLYFSDLHALRDLTIGLFIGGLIYMPFCMLEMVISPRLHRIVYGFHPHVFGQSRRWGGWRPVVFMQHGLMVGMWMTTASLAGIHLLQQQKLDWVKTLLHVKKAGLVVGFLIFVTIFCKSTGALMLLVAGVVVLQFCIRFKLRFPLYILMAAPLIYVALRTTGTWSSEKVIDLLSTRLHLPEERVGSLAFRFVNEDILMDKAFGRAAFGWGGWKRSFVFNRLGVPISVPDGLWILVFGQNGWLGLLSMYMTMLLPQWLYLRRFPPKLWVRGSDIAVGLAPVVLLGLFSVDSLLNDMFNPLLMLLAGGMIGLYLTGETTDSSGGNGTICSVGKSL